MYIYIYIYIYMNVCVCTYRTNSYFRLAFSVLDLRTHMFDHCVQHTATHCNTLHHTATPTHCLCRYTHRIYSTLTPQNCDTLQHLRAVSTGTHTVYRRTCTCFSLLRHTTREISSVWMCGCVVVWVCV